MEAFGGALSPQPEPAVTRPDQDCAPRSRALDMVGDQAIVPLGHVRERLAMGGSEGRMRKPRVARAARRPAA